MVASMETLPILPTAGVGDKTLNASFVRDKDERATVAYNTFSDEVPVISLDGIDDSSRREAICAEIVEACEQWGLFQVVDHGIDAQLISDMSELSRDFFALPAEEKFRHHMTTAGQKGGFIVSSHLKGQTVMDWREFVTYFSYPVRDRDYSRWPDRPAAWRAVTEEYSERLMGLACKLLGVLSEAMGFDKDALTEACVDMDQKIVVNYYPKCPQPELTLGLRRHTDPGTITLLLQDDVGGLQATNDGGKTWITVQPIPGAFVVNLGDHGHLLSNGRFKNADHRVVVNSEHSRLSIATFQNPAPEATVYPLVVRNGEKPMMEKPITFAEMYKEKMIRDSAEAAGKRNHQVQN